MLKLAFAAGALVFLAACGSEATLPDQGECEPPAPEETADETAAEYLGAVNIGLSKLESYEETFREEWDGRRLRERDRFREDYARYAHLGHCTTDVLIDLDPPPELEDFDITLEGFAIAYQDALDDGERYVASRNRSGYDRWIEDIDELNEELAELAGAVRTLPSN